jgi:hypothetical protein
VRLELEGPNIVVAYETTTSVEDINSARTRTRRRRATGLSRGESGGRLRRADVVAAAFIGEDGTGALRKTFSFPGGPPVGHVIV